MRSVVLWGRRDLRLLDVPVPIPMPGEMLVEVKSCGVCPGDVRAWATWVRTGDHPPIRLGHEATGVVVEVGDPLDRVHLGTRVFADGLGGFSDFKIIDKDSLAASGGPTLLPDKLSFEDGVFVEPLADCLFALEIAVNLDHATGAVVIGCGQMGLLLVRLCTLRGLTVVACDPLDERRYLAQSFGAELSVAECQVESICDALPGGLDLALVACPDTSAVPAALRVLREGGRCVLFSGYETHSLSQVDLALIRHKRLSVIGSRWIHDGTIPYFSLYRRAANLLSHNLVDMSLVQPRTVGLSVEDLTDAFEDIRDHKIMKAIVRL